MALATLMGSTSGANYSPASRKRQVKKPKPEQYASLPSEPRRDDDLMDDFFVSWMKEQEGSVVDPATGLHTVYIDQAGHPTVGYGHKLTAEELSLNSYAQGLPEERARELLSQDMQGHIGNARRVTDRMVNEQGAFDRLPKRRRQGLVDFAFNLGPEGMSRFKNFVPAYVKGDLDTSRQQYVRKAKNRKTKEYEPLGKRNPDFLREFINDAAALADPVQVSMATANGPSQTRPASQGTNDPWQMTFGKVKNAEPQE